MSEANHRVKRYQKEKVLGEGTFGIVNKAKDTKTGQYVAIKKVRMGNSKDGVAIPALREIKILQDVRHENLINLLDVFGTSSNINLVFDYCIADLEQIIKDKTIALSTAEVKGALKMILCGVAKLHENWVLHRDLKPSNILMDTQGVLKLTDFGLSKLFASPYRKYTNQVVTRWYRAPELLFGATQYGTGIDMWSVGCIFAEMMLRQPYFPGDSDIDQLSKIYSALGTPTEEEWPGVAALPAYVEFTPKPRPPMRQTFTAASDEALDLLNQFLLFDPWKRISAQDALNHPYFKKPPLPCSPNQFLEKVKSGRLFLDSDSRYSLNQVETDDPLSKRRRYSDLGKRRLEF
ncbi:Cyclin-dependent kinase 7 [Galdieria sulphuraria]|uniref:[RNA-polymerase]-subunit kinase n=1 Tax=Galdieria sulphuraria TaxID=130081 RepID=M2XXR7_GALSU|nr:cyclin-dependent serine/threonine protein kinase [Galdieria sulphuraria]EME28234.1 cyclin-dependent serine/threonine protein kinase [Galdieria sulphuraria]GJD11062.1 Cyclin-dependent kinase 7 [Galdieria sulphuraria]|eukprot:XP_005704754.1 cyclin-dependent serine/threonine protein kinase [Galdieria sulphuraria]